QAANPLRVEVTQSSAASTWSKDLADKIPFGGQVHHVEAFAPLGRVQTSSGGTQTSFPYFEAGGSSNQELDVRWPNSTRGTLFCSVRCDAVD
ncbi:MAG: hypothetical protein AAF826_11375, partial [Pseudomonadota bacterium]